jgi:V/A-type H+-transporting ATPase subunit I
MIVPMKKVQALFLARHRDEVLETLRAAGVVHLAPAAAPAGTDLDALCKQVHEVRDEISRLAAVRPAPADALPPVTADELLTDVRRSRGRLEQLAADRAVLSRRLEELAPFGDFDPVSFAALASAGRSVRLLRLPASAADQPPPPGVVLHVLHRSRSTAWAVQIGGEAPVASAEEIITPTESPSTLRARLGELDREIGRDRLVPARVAARLPVLRRHLGQLEASVEMLEAQLGLTAHDEILVLEGYAPAEQAEPLTRLAASAGWGVRVSDPAPGEEPPTLIRNPAWIRPIESVLKAIEIIPGYREVDISAVFLLFFSLFFAMLVGDAGYGLIFLILTLLARRKIPLAPAEPFRMLVITSVATMLWGGLTGTVFGYSLAGAPLSGWAASEAKVMHFCFMIGAVHLSIAHIWAALRSWNSFTALAQLGWICTTWTMYFMAGDMVLGRPVPDWLGVLFLGGVGLIVVFMTPPREFKQQWFNHFMLPLGLVSNFVDVISYLRLYAVGFASLAMASTFNEMAFSGSGISGGVLAAFTLFLGHALNIILAAMGVLVHGVRLNTLEFSAHIGNQWSGTPYAPFARRDGGAATQTIINTSGKES